LSIFNDRLLSSLYPDVAKAGGLSEYAFLTTWIAYEKALSASNSIFPTMDKANFACVNNDLKVYVKILYKDNHLQRFGLK